MYMKEVDSIQKDTYNSARRCTCQAFQRACLAEDARTSLAEDHFESEWLGSWTRSCLLWHVVGRSFVCWRATTRISCYSSLLTLTPWHVRVSVNYKPEEPVHHEPFIKGIQVVLKVMTKSNSKWASYCFWNHNISCFPHHQGTRELYIQSRLEIQ